MSASRVLVTGGAGFIGSHLVDALVRRGDRIVVLDDLTTGVASNLDGVAEEIELVEGSTTDAELVERLVADAETCFHLASAVGVQLVVSNPLQSLLSNVRGADNVLGAAARNDTRLLFTSTSEVYGKNSSGALNEEADRLIGSPFKARWCYETSKAFGECLAHSYFRDRGAAMTVVRLFNTVGPRQTGRYGMVVPSFVRQALDSRPLSVYGDGSQTRCFAHVQDTVRGILGLIDAPGSVGGVYNIGTSTEIPIIELARRVIEHAESDSQIDFVPYEDAYEDGFEELGRRKPDTTAIRELTGWRPELTVDDAIKDVVTFERQRQGGSPLAA
jgi:nucleoside-diphosphate-sugar epimerase